MDNQIPLPAAAAAEKEGAILLVQTAADNAINLINVAHEKAQALLNKAAEDAENLKAATITADDKTAETLSIALRDVFGENENAKRFIDVSRIPLICQSILDIHKSVASINNNIAWGVKIVLGTVISSLMYLVLKTSLHF